MATLGLLFIGMLFGLFLSLVMVAFALLHMDPGFRAELFAGRLNLRQLLPAPGKPAGSRPRTALSVPLELDQKLRALQEEVRVGQKLLEQARVEREARSGELKALRAELADLQTRLEAREGEVRKLTDEVTGAASTHRDLLQELSRRDEDLTRRSTEAKDLRMELELMQSGDSVTAGQVARLQKERDALARLVQRLKQELATGQPPGPRAASGS